MFSVAICDDNALQISILQDMVEEYVASRNLQFKISTFASGPALLKAVETQGCFDIYLLDVIMPDMTGIQTGEKLRSHGDSGKIVFITATVDYAAASYDVQAFHYLVKPVGQEKFFEVLDKIIKSFDGRSSVLSVKTSAGEKRLNVDDLLYVDMVDRALNYHMLDGSVVESIKLRGPFSEAVSVLVKEAGFTMCGASIALSLRHIDTMGRESISMTGGYTVYPPRTGYADAHKAWVEYMQNRGNLGSK